MDLKTIVLALTNNDAVHTKLEGLDIYRIDQPYPRTSLISPPAVCFIAQGKKSLYLGKQEIVYDEHHYLIGSVKMPIESELKEASEDRPYLGIVLTIDPVLINELLLEMDGVIDWEETNIADRIITSAEIDVAVEQSLIRLLSALSDPLRARVLGQSLIREVFFNVLRGRRGYVLRNSVLHHAKAHRMASVIQYLEKHFKEALEITDIAKYAHMSHSALHEHFKEATSLSPIQYIKKLRLHHAYTLLLGGTSAGMAASDSGYESQAQFSREFKRHFGFLPREVNKPVTQ